ncbi:MAG: hypothetical protein KBB11_05850 [Bacteroidales bacterium]|nr:hypothetical protein [Bacteroidales bacterium]HOY37925.1 hypothetical protein [Bacteroidales bacterium]HQP03511.1 hypothetical protein [Bacteroidales bacterium]
MAFSFFKLPGHSVFEYQPRYFDLEKERINKRRRQLKLERGEDITDPDNPGSSIKGSYSSLFQRNSKYKKQSAVRILIRLAFLAVLIYLLMQVDFSSFLNFINN